MRLWLTVDKQHLLYIPSPLDGERARERGAPVERARK
jgi:hypothetical protein